jgi:tRNA nucleotidyltransferase (CCA-adding enzyme)
MPDITSLLKPQQRDVFDAIRNTADALNLHVYLVGGAVRDWLLKLEQIDDLDFVVEGDAIAFAEQLKSRHGGEVHTYPRFGTATWHLGDVSVDVTMARRESYACPAALPTVSPTDLHTDLRRRDFTINAISMRLGNHELIDPLGGQVDLQRGAMRVIHSRSFVDDPTRMLRGARYAARFNFALTPDTRAALDDGLPHIRALSGERMKYDLELIFADHTPERALALLHEWGVFRAISIPAPEPDKLVQRFERAREVMAANEWDFESLNMGGPDLIRAIGWGALVYNVGQLAVSRWVDWIPFEHHVRDALVSLGVLSTLSAASFHARPSRQSELLHEFSGLALLLGNLFDPDRTKRRAMLCEWKDWRGVRQVTTGDDLRALGIPPGPAYSRVLHRLRNAWLDGEVKSYAEEQALVQKLIESEGLW